MADSPSEPDRDLRLFELGEELRAALAAGESIRPGAWALRFDLEVAEVEQALAALDQLAFAPPAPQDADPAAHPAHLSHPGPDYRPSLPPDLALVEELGRGGMGVVWKAHQASLDRDVAVKVLMPGERVFGQALERFRREAKSLARLRHRHIVRIHDVGEHDGHLYFVMDLVEGQSLGSLLAEEGPLNVARAVRLMRQVASAVAYVHERGLVHRDLKPGNVLVDGEGDAFVVDFGLALDPQAGQDLTLTGHLVGTPAYMAPEQARGDRAAIGEASDVYAMGAILYECLGGAAPFAGLGLVDLVHAVLHTDPKPLGRRNRMVPSPLELVVSKAMAKEPAERYPTARAFLEDLERFEEGRSVRAEVPSLGKELRRFVKRRRTTLLTIFATVAMTLLLLKLGPVVQDARPSPLVTLGQELLDSEDPEAAGSVLARAWEAGEALSDEHLATALNRVLLTAPARAAEVGETLEKRLSSHDRIPELRLPAVLAARIEGRDDRRAAHVEQLQWSYQDPSLQIALDRCAPLLADPESELGKQLAWDLLENSRLNDSLLTWLTARGPDVAELFSAWIRFGCEQGRDVRTALHSSWGDDEHNDLLHVIGEELLPRLLDLASTGPAAARVAALHEGCLITGIPASPWDGPITAAPELLLLHLEAWQNASPVEREMQLFAFGNRIRAKPRAWWRQHLSQPPKGPDPESQDAQEARGRALSKVLGLSAEVPSVPLEELWHGFQAAEPLQRRTWHAALVVRFGPGSPLWPSTHFGKPTREPRPLASAWQELIQPDAERDWNLHWRWFQLDADASDPRPIAEGSQSLERGKPFRLEADLLMKRPWAARDWAPGPRYLNSKPSQEQATTSALVGYDGQVERLRDGIRLTWSAPTRQQKAESFRHRGFVYLQEYAPGEAHLVASVISWLPDDQEQTSYLCAALVDPGSNVAPSDAAWLAILREQLAKDAQAERERELAQTEPPSSFWDSRTNRIVLGSLAAFVILSAGLGLWSLLLTVRRRGHTRASIGRTTCLLVLACLLTTDFVLKGNLRLPLGPLACGAALAGLSLWLSIKPGFRSPWVRLTAALWLSSAGLVLWTLRGGGQAPLAWATLAWHLGYVTSALSLELGLRRQGFARVWTTVCFWLALSFLVTMPLLGGLSLALETLPFSVAQAAARAIARAMTDSPLMVIWQRLLSSNPGGILFHLVWWPLNWRLSDWLKSRTTPTSARP